MGWLFNLFSKKEAELVKPRKKRKVPVRLSKKQVAKVERSIIARNTSSKQITHLFNISSDTLTRIRHGKHRYSSTKYKKTIRLAEPKEEKLDFKWWAYRSV